LPLATFQGIPLSDDVFTSDLLDGEWPMRVAIARSFARGEGTAWNAEIYGGYPALAGGAGADPLTLLSFAWLPPTAGLDLFILLALLLIAFGTSRLARELGASRLGAVQLLPQLELASLSDRAGGVSAEFALKYAYAPSNALQFLSPYLHGDVSNRTYTGAGIFWETFGYVGIGTLLLALLALEARR